MGVLYICREGAADLREREEALGEGDDVLHLSDVVDAVLDGLGVVRARGVEDALDARDLRVRPVTVRLADGLETEKKGDKSLGTRRDGRKTAPGQRE